MWLIRLVTMKTECSNKERSTLKLVLADRAAIDKAKGPNYSTEVYMLILSGNNAIMKVDSFEDE